MKKVLLLLLAITLCIGASGCSTEGDTNTSTPSQGTSTGGVQLPDQPF